MAFLDENYGKAEAKRSRVVKRAVFWGVLGIIVGVSLFLYFRNYSQERTFNRFMTLLKQHNYGDAYKMWDDPETRSSYTPDRFLQDWGPDGLYKNVAESHVEFEDSCGDAVVFTLTVPGQDPVGISVTRGTNIIGFFIAPRCPGKHWHIKEFFKSVFGG
jgi:hypothetical protein